MCMCVERHMHTHIETQTKHRHTDTQTYRHNHRHTDTQTHLCKGGIKGGEGEGGQGVESGAELVEAAAGGCHVTASEVKPGGGWW